MVGFNNDTLMANAVVATTLITTPRITISNVPTVGTDGTNKAYVDLIAMGSVYKAPCYCASTINITATYNNAAAGVGATLTNAGTMAAFSVDGVSPPINSRVLIKDQTALPNNGIYTLTTVGSGAANWVLTRATDYDSSAEIVPGTLVPVEFGDANDSTLWLEIATVTTVGTDPIVFIQFGSAPLVVDQYAVLVGGLNNTVVSIDPSATSGMAFTSTGSSSNPTFSNAVVVAGGGTGVESFANNNSIVLTGATSTSSLTSLTSGTSGLPLVSQGAGTSPSFSSINVPAGGTGVSSFSNNNSLILTGASSLAAITSLASGASGTVLTSNGSGIAPSFQAASSNAISSLNAQVFTSSGTYTPTTNMSFCIVTICGAGGGGGNTSGPSNSAGGGGGAGGTVQMLFTAAQIGASQFVTLGTGGTGGNNGSNSTFGSYITSAGGSSGQTHSGAASGGSGGSSSSNTGILLINYPGQGGTFGMSGSSGGTATFAGGSGGATFMGGGASGSAVVTSSGFNQNGNNSSQGGGGGSGALSMSNSASIGGSGGNGYCTILEFIS